MDGRMDGKGLCCTVKHEWIFFMERRIKFLLVWRTNSGGGRQVSSRSGRETGLGYARVASCRMLSFSPNCREAARLHTGECEVSARSRLENIT